MKDNDVNTKEQVIVMDLLGKFINLCCVDNGMFPRQQAVSDSSSSSSSSDHTNRTN